MLILRSFPAVEDVPANREFRRFFYSKWGRENCVISARARHAEYRPYTQRLSVKTAWGGCERYHLDNRTVAVDDDNYLVLNDSRTYGSTLRSDLPVHSFTIHFRPGLAEETLAGLEWPAHRALDEGDAPESRPIEFPEHLRPHDRLVTPLLRYIAAQVESGLEDDMWYEEQFSFLLERMLRAHRRTAAVADSLEMTRDATRKEILRRIGWSTDHINTYYMRPLDTGQLARAASLSRFHFIRLFRAVHGMTPFAYLQRKRAVAARRLLLATRLSQEEVAARVGFESRSTLYRQLLRLTGAGVRALRQGDRAG